MEINFELVQPLESHAKQIMEWRNDPVTLQNSLHTKPKVWDSFYPSFLQTEFCFPDLPSLFVLVEGKRVAYLKFKLVLHSLKCCDVSINVAPDMRGQKVGESALLAIQPWLKRQGYEAIMALVKLENTPSQHLFEKVGFKKLDQVDYLVEDLDLHVPVYRYLRILNEKQGPVFIIAEAGSNWRIGTEEENWEMARRMIRTAKECGADAIKFQTFRADTIYVPNAGSSDYLETKEEMKELFQKLEMPYDIIPKLYEECQNAGIEFMSSVFSPADFAAVDPYVKRHKIASYEIGHIHLLELAAKCQKPLLLSTGGSTEFEIEWAVDTYRENGGADLTLLQCTACYPAPMESMNLKAIPWLKNRFQVESGLSDHSKEPLTAPIMAVALGATVVEKHFTMDRGLPGPDHAFSVNPEELKALVRSIREAEAMTGQEVKGIHPVEDELVAFAKRGIQAIKPIKAGEILQEGVNIAILRPGKQRKGLHSRFLKEMEGKSAKRALNLGEGVQKGDYA